ncbi:class I SAM-dependent RNA methyltransferase [Yoonia sp. 208BN28-4]|uniref:class I SAM-dependent RNA methyltransferase n=1 Tax=Yoonia sp. 208BN28-4 TaxID=3126505 RepID=UPI0030A89BC7
MALIEGLTHLGLGKVDDGRTLLPRVLPGEEVAVAQDGTVRIVTPSSDRVAAPCRHFKSCGGCAMQHASDAFVADWKQEIVRRALAAQRIEPDFRPMHTSPALSRRRAKFSGRRTKKGVLLGFHAKGSDTVVAVPDCLLVTPMIKAAFPALEALIPLACSRKGEIGLTVTDTANGPDVLIDTDKDLTGELRIELAAFAQTHKLARLVWQDEVIVTMLPPVQQMGPAKVTPPAGAFLQATQDGEAALLAAVQEITKDADRIVDLFCGVGTFALPLAQASEVHAVEGEEDMTAALDRAWRETKGLKRITIETRDLFRRPLQPDEFAKFDAVVIDPPRAGAEAQIETLAASDIAVIAMVSCNPVTFARDAKTLIAAGFTLNWVKVVDQFRWSPHVEVVASFTRS